MTIDSDPEIHSDKTHPVQADQIGGNRALHFSSYSGTTCCAKTITPERSLLTAFRQASIELDALQSFSRLPSTCSATMIRPRRWILTACHPASIWVSRFARLLLFLRLTERPLCTKKNALLTGSPHILCKNLRLTGLDGWSPSVGLDLT